MFFVEHFTPPTFLARLSTEMEVFENFQRNFEANQRSEFLSDLAFEPALESFKLVFKDGNVYQVCVHIRHITGTCTTEWILKQNFARWISK